MGSANGNGDVMTVESQRGSLGKGRRFAILGGGPGGLAAAAFIQQRGLGDVVLYERSDRLGGLQHSLEFDGRHFDVGTFLYSEDHGLLQAFPHLREIMVPIEYRPKSITPKGSVVNYPFSLKGYVRDEGALSTMLAAGELLYSKLRFFRRASVADFARYYMGGRVYRQTGLQHYIHRLHDVPDCDLDVYFAQTRLHTIQRLSFRSLLMRAASRGYRKQKRSEFRDRLVRPAAGFPFMYDTIEDELIKQGVTINKGCQVDHVTSLSPGFEITTPAGTEVFDELISTVPVPVMKRLLGDKTVSSVENRDLISLFYEGNISNKSSVYFNFTFEAKWKRVTVFSRFYGGSPDYFTVEITTDRATDEQVQQVARQFEDHAARYQLVDGSPKLLGHFITPRAYPVFRAGQMGRVEAEKEQLVRQGIRLLGRQGNFDYIISDRVAQKAERLIDQMATEAVR